MPTPPYIASEPDAGATHGAGKSAGDPPDAGEQLPLQTLITYGLPSMALAMMGSMVSLYLLIFVTDTLLVPAGVFGVAFAISRVWDGVSDPIVGFLSDATRARMGRRRPWLAWGVLPLSLSFLALWAPPSLAETAITIWVAVAIVIFYTCSTVVGVPHMAWGAELSLSYQDRNRVFGGRALFTMGGVLLAAGGMRLLEGASSQRSMAANLAMAAGVLAIGLFAFCVIRLKERPEFQERGPNRPDSALLDVFKNRYARMLLVVFFVDSLGFGCLMVLFPYMTKYTMGEGASAGLFVGVTMLVAVASFPLWIRLSQRFGKRDPWIASTILKCIAFVSIYFVGPETQGLMWVTVVVMGLAQPAGMILAPSIQADVVDYDEYQSGQRKEGTYFATFNLAEKSANALAILVASTALALIGYEPNAEQGGEIIETLRFLFAGLPLALHLIGLVVLFRFDFNADAHAQVREKLERRRQSRASNAHPSATGPSGS